MNNQDFDIYIIDGNNFSDEKGFYEEFTVKVVPEIASWWGKNLDALNDTIGGGLGSGADGDFKLIWKNSDKSRKELGDGFEKIIEVIKSHNNVELILE